MTNDAWDGVGVRRFYVRRKDFSPFPFQFYIDRDGVERRLEPGQVFTYTFTPPREQVEYLHIFIPSDFAEWVESRWGISPADHIRIAATAFEAWLRLQAPDTHQIGMNMIRVDTAWYPQAIDGSPALAPNFYSFEVETDEPWPMDSFWQNLSKEETA